MKNGAVAYWFDDADLTYTRSPLQQDIDVDVVIVGAGFSGLWTAYYLKQMDSSLSIAILEAEFAGYGASGRNGGHLTSGLPGMERLYLKQHSPESINEFQRQINATIDEVIRVAALEGIDADIVKGGTAAVARNPAQLARLREEYKGQKSAANGGEELIMLSKSEMAEYINMDGTLGGTWSPHCARVQPAKLAKGLAETVERLGVTIYEHSQVANIHEGQATLRTGVAARARYVIRATEGFTPELAGQKRDWLPKLSPQIITEPLSQSVIDEIWPSTTMSNDAGHMFSYLQKTADNRIALGGPGLPYYWGSRIDDRGFTERSSIRDLKKKLHTFFPVLRNSEVTHAWTGVLGVPRDWSATASLDEVTGLGVIGGYVGTGVTATNLAGRTIAEKITGNESIIQTLPWVNKKIRNWEIEPVRWVALRGLYKAYVVADELEDRFPSKRTSLVATLANRISGRY